MRCTKRTPIDDDAENAVIRPLEACVSLSTEGSVNLAKNVIWGYRYFRSSSGVSSEQMEL